MLLFLVFFALTTTPTTTACITLDIPSNPPSGTQILDGSFQGYSMEVADFADIAGNLSSPNVLSIRMLQNLYDITGSPVHIRVGGTTANHVTYIPSQKEAIIPYYDVPGADQPANVSIGPAYFESFKTFPNGTKYTMGLTFDSGKSGENKSVSEARAFLESLGDRLWAFEVGNEFDVFPVDRDESAWSIEKYVPEWLDRTAAIAQRAFGNREPKQRFQAGAFVAPGLVNNDTSWTTKAAIDLGIASTGRAKTFCTHQYFGAACGPVKPTLAGNVMNRTQITHNMAYHQESGAYSVSKGLPYVIGETNSIACQGLTGVSDVFGAAIWSIDYALYAASLNVSSLYWHMGVAYRYAPWQAIQNGTTASGPRPLYYGNIFVATALGSANKQVVSIVNTTSLAGYAIYAAAHEQQHAKLENIVLINMGIFNSTANEESERSAANFSIPRELTDREAKLTARRLTGAGAEIKDGISFAGRTVALNGTITGKEEIESINNGVVEVKATEALLISLS